MSLGFGIFLSALVFALLYLYQITRDRWNWSRVGRRSLVALGVVLAVAALGVVCIFVFEAIRNAPHQQTGYADLRLGMTMSEVKYVKGYPPNVVDKNATDKWGGWIVVDATKGLKEGQHIEDFAMWLYDPTDRSRIDVDFDLKKGTVKGIGCFSSGIMDCPPLFGLQDGTTEDIILQTLGEPSHQQIDGVTKLMKYNGLRIWFYLQQSKVYMMWVKDLGSFDYVYGGQIAPCKNGAERCEPRERDWSKTELKPGSIVTDQGTATQPSPTKP